MHGETSWSILQHGTLGSLENVYVVSPLPSNLVVPPSVWYGSLHIGIGAAWKVSSLQIPTYLLAWSWKEMIRIHVFPNIFFSLAQFILSQKKRQGWGDSTFSYCGRISPIFNELFSEIICFSCFPWGSNDTMAVSILVVEDKNKQVILF